MPRPVVVSLCDITGVMVEPWTRNGYEAVLVDPQHGDTRWDGRVMKAALTVEESLPFLAEILRTREVAAVFGFPPCKDLAVSGARWFSAKREYDPMFQAKAVAVAEQCRTFGAVSGAPYFVENPMSVLTSVWGEPDHTFNPYDYTLIAPEDNYPKLTCLWTGNDFRMPKPQRNTSLGKPDDRIHLARNDKDRANTRSITPRGFAEAVYAANRKGD